VTPTAHWHRSRTAHWHTRRVAALDAHVALAGASLEAQHSSIGALEDTRRSPLGERLEDGGVPSTQCAPGATAPEQQGHALEYSPDGMD